MDLGQPHLDVVYENRWDELYSILIDLTDPDHANGSENFEVSNTELVTFFYDGGWKGSPIETTYFQIIGRQGTYETNDGHETECFYVEEINEISAEEAENKVGLS